MKRRRIKDLTDSDADLFSQMLFYMTFGKLIIGRNLIEEAAEMGSVCEQDVRGFFDFCKQYHKSDVIPDFYYSATIRGKIAHVFHCVWYFLRGGK